MQIFLWWTSYIRAFGGNLKLLLSFKRKPENYLLNKMIAVRELCSLHELHVYLW